MLYPSEPELLFADAQVAGEAYFLQTEAFKCYTPFFARAAVALFSVPSIALARTIPALECCLSKAAVVYEFFSDFLLSET